VRETLVEGYETNVLLESSPSANADDGLTAGDTGNGELRLSKNYPVNVPAVSRESTKDDKSTLLIPPRVVSAVIEPERIVRLTEDSSAPGPRAPRLGYHSEMKNAPGQLISPTLPAELRMSELALAARPARRPREEMGASATSAPTAEPTVQVTIGRIEVRASKEKSNSSRATAASPVMPLDEYLRKRAQRAGQ
jgi:hypothetical protein